MNAGGRRGNIEEGLVILDHSSNPWTPSRWFTRDYGFFSPTPLQWRSEPLHFDKGDRLRLRYRVMVHADAPQSAELSRLSADFNAESDCRQLVARPVLPLQ
jgi:hypothetical protein